MRKWAFPAFAAVMLVLPALPVPDFWITQSIYIGLYAIVALGLVLLTGVSGLTSFGQAAFVGVGAYTAAFLAVKLGISPWLTLLVGVALAIAAALVLGAITLRMSGHYLPLATIAWGLALNYTMANMEWLGKYDGILGIPSMRLFGVDLGTGRGLHPLAWAIARHLVEKNQSFRLLRTTAHLFAMLPMAVPGLVLGLGYIFFFNAPNNPLHGLYQTTALLTLCTIIHFYTTGHLTAVTALNDKTWLAVGHGGTILRSEDGGQTWVSVQVPDAGTDALLGGTALDAKTLLAYGAFGLFLKSTDEGRTWTRRDVIEEGFDRHIAKVIPLGDALVMVGESGTIARSTDGGTTWTRVDSPYEGSFFGGLRTADVSALIFGMRGNVFRSTDAGRTWKKVETGTKVAFNGGGAFDDGTIVLAGKGHEPYQEVAGRVLPFDDRQVVRALLGSLCHQPA